MTTSKIVVQLPGLDVERTAQILASLSNPVRLRILDTLREPRQLKDIKVRPAREEGGKLPARNMSRASVKEHLDKLMELDLVRKGSNEVGNRRVETYLINHARVYLVAEEMRRVSLLSPKRPDGDTTAILNVSKSAKTRKGATLTLVNGVQEGHIFQLTSTADGKSAWSIGRDIGNDVHIPFDPFISLHNSRIEAKNGKFHLHGAADSRNGTRLNWQPIDSEVPQSLTSGDVIGIGRCLLVFRND
jgi:DNA-binding transcriptional ArsR family regulator